jgi:hypothetical protein
MSMINGVNEGNEFTIVFGTLQNILRSMTVNFRHGSLNEPRIFLISRILICNVLHLHCNHDLYIGFSPPFPLSKNLIYQLKRCVGLRLYICQTHHL